VKLSYNDFHRVTKSEQAHDGAVTGGTPAVQYAYDLGLQVGNIWVDNTRLEKVTYPDGRVIGHTFGHASTRARWTHAAFGG
jgi:hypothetical protein